MADAPPKIAGRHTPCDCEQKNCTCKGNGNSIYCVKDYNL